MSDFYNIVSDIEPAQTHFEVTDDKGALWCAGKLFEANTKRAALEAKYKEYRQRLDDWRDAELKDIERTDEHMTALLQPWVARETARAKAKHIDLPGARMGYRSLPIKVEIKDEAAAIEWAADNAPDALRVKTEVDKRELKKLLGNGEVIPGAELVPGTQRLYVEER